MCMSSFPVLSKHLDWHTRHSLRLAVATPQLTLVSYTAYSARPMWQTLYRFAQKKKWASLNCTEHQWSSRDWSNVTRPSPLGWGLGTRIQGGWITVYKRQLFLKKCSLCNFVELGLCLTVIESFCEICTEKQALYATTQWKLWSACFYLSYDEKCSVIESLS